MAAITGALVGARVGAGGLPAPLLDRLMEWPRSVAWIRRLGEALARATLDGRSQPPVPLSMAALLLRNLLFIPLVLAHGLRRLLPPW